MLCNFFFCFVFFCTAMLCNWSSLPTMWLTCLHKLNLQISRSCVPLLLLFSFYRHFWKCSPADVGQLQKGQESFMNLLQQNAIKIGGKTGPQNKTCYLVSIYIIIWRCCWVCETCCRWKGRVIMLSWSEVKLCLGLGLCLMDEWKYRAKTKWNISQKNFKLLIFKVWIQKKNCTI